MSRVLPEPQIVNCSSEEVFEPHLSALCLDWGGKLDPGQDRRWDLPGGVAIHGPAPVRFSIFVQRHAADRYFVRLVWDHTHLAWGGLTRRQVLDSCLGPLLTAIGTDPEYLLDQPVDRR